MNSYDIKTIADIIEKIPADRFDDFLGEFIEGLRDVKATYELMIAIGDAMNLTPDKTAQFDHITWNDDGEKSQTTIIEVAEL